MNYDTGIGPHSGREEKEGHAARCHAELNKRMKKQNEETKKHLTQLKLNHHENQDRRKRGPG